MEKRIRGKITMMNILKQNSSARRNHLIGLKESTDKEIALYMNLKNAIEEYFN